MANLVCVVAMNICYYRSVPIKGMHLACPITWIFCCTCLEYTHNLVACHKVVCVYHYHELPYSYLWQFCHWWTVLAIHKYSCHKYTRVRVDRSNQQTVHQKDFYRKIAHTQPHNRAKSKNTPSITPAPSNNKIISEVLQYNTFMRYYNTSHIMQTQKKKQQQNTINKAVIEL